jgi:eukaryotic-like serine/threonine-protein kinase
MTDPRAQLEKIVGGAYTIERELGGGGMSRVYFAKEIGLGRTVVIKVLPPEMSAAVNVERFLREIQLAARLQHPHVVSMLTAASGGELLYYVMPYISGESLRARLERDGALPVAEAVRIIREVVDALAYAHAQGVVHRDIKPDNVLLSSGHAVVTDFGVAKAVTASSGCHSSLTSLGVALGTPAYMAPEQAAADPHVDHRADIYAVGALAYEVLTGRTPFIAPTPQAMLAAHITKQPEPIIANRPNVPPALNAVLMRCLEKHPGDRWQTADELLRQLDAVLTPSGGMAPTDATMAVSSGTKEALKKSHPVRVIAAFAGAAIATLAVVWVAVQQLGLPDWVFYGSIILLILGFPIILATGYFERKRAQARATGTIIPPSVSGVHRFFTWQKAMRGGYLAFAGLGIITAIYTAMRLLGIGPVGTLMASGKLGASGRLIVAEFVNRTSDSTLGGTLTEALRIDLSQSRALRIMTGSAMREALTRMQRSPSVPVTAEVALEMAAREGAKAIVAGEVSTAGRSYVLVARILGAGGEELVALRETSPDDAGIVAAIDRLSSKVRERIGESLKSIREGTPLARVTTSSLEALRYYSEASRLSLAEEDVAAIAQLRQAIAIDSTFAMAWRKLAVAIGNSGGSWDEVTEATIKAYQLRDRLPEQEREATVAFYHAYADRDARKVEVAYKRMLAIDSLDPIATFNLTMLYTATERCDDGQRLARRGMAAGVDLMGPLFYALTCAGDFDAIRREFARLGADTLTPRMTWYRAFAQAVESPDSEATAVWSRLVTSDANRGRELQNYQLISALEATRGRLSSSAQRGLEAMAVADRQGVPGAALTWAVEMIRLRLVLTGDTARAAGDLAKALARYPLASIPLRDQPIPMIALVYATLGQSVRARTMLDDFDSRAGRGYARVDYDWWRARNAIDLAEGRLPEALAHLRAMQGEGGFGWMAEYPLAVTFEAAGQTDSAIVHYERAAAARGALTKILDDPHSRAPSHRRLGELHEARGNTEKALEHYGKFVELWKDADPVLQPQVKDVKGRMARLAGEPK